MTVADTVANGNDFIEINGNQRHVMSYLGDFLFAPARARSPVKSLSGGEKNRLLLARLFTRPANVIVMDEPTNDLDLETLEMLEEKLVEFQGTLLIVSHDRAFLDNVVTNVIVFVGEGEVQEFVGGYSDWLHYDSENKQQLAAAEKKQKAANAEKKAASAPIANSAKKRKLNFKEQKELETLPDLIAELEAAQGVITEKMSAPSFYQQDAKMTAKTLDELKAVEEKLEQAFDRWNELESLLEEIG
jgi:ATP-binding cassette subfamily F protein uup